MKKPDARRLGEESLRLLRSQAHRSRLDGRTWAEIASIVGVSLGTKIVWARCYLLGSDEFSEENVVSLRRGRVQGANRTLSSDDEALLRHGSFKIGRRPMACRMRCGLGVRFRNSSVPSLIPICRSVPLVNT